jgi:hypothetical protein
MPERNLISDVIWMKESEVYRALLALEESTLELKKMSEQCATLKTTPTAKKSSAKISKTNGSTTPQSGLIYTPLMEDPGMEKWILSLEDSHAKISRSPAKAQASKKAPEADCGLKCSDSSKKSAPNTCSLKMSQQSADADSKKSLKVLPKQGMMLNGQCSELKTLEPHTEEKDGSVSHNWRTPHASDGEGGVMEMREGTTGHYKLRDHVMPINKKFWPTPQRMDFRNDVRHPDDRSAAANEGGCSNLREAVIWPTIRSCDYKDCGPYGSKSQIHHNKKGYLDGTVKERDGDAEAKKGLRLNPDWVEWLMGLPIGFTDSAKETADEFNGWKTDPATLDIDDANYIPRITDRKELRINRLKCLGNAVVPQQAMLAWDRLYNNEE